MGSPLSYQGVCGRHDEEDHCCYPGRTPGVPCKKDKQPYKENEMGSEASGVVGQLNSTGGLVKAKLSAIGGHPECGWGRQLVRMVEFKTLAR